jgi:hypothetical protein
MPLKKLEPFDVLFDNTLESWGLNKIKLNQRVECGCALMYMN